MKIAIIIAGFTPGEADQLRKAMATFRKTDKIGELGLKMIAGMVERGYEKSFAERCFRQIEGVWQLWFSRKSCSEFCIISLRVKLDEMSYASYFCGCLVKFSAWQVLRASTDCPRRS